MTSRLEETRRRFEDHKLKFEKLRADVNIKLKFLEENKVLPSYSLLAQCIVCAYSLLQKVVCVCVRVCILDEFFFSPSWKAQIRVDFFNIEVNW